MSEKQSDIKRFEGKIVDLEAKLRLSEESHSKQEGKWQLGFSKNSKAIADLKKELQSQKKAKEEELQKHAQTKKELNSTKDQLSRTKAELDWSKDKLTV